MQSFVCGQGNFIRKYQDFLGLKRRIKKNHFVKTSTKLNTNIANIETDMMAPQLSPHSNSDIVEPNTDYKT